MGARFVRVWLLVVAALLFGASGVGAWEPPDSPALQAGDEAAEPAVPEAPEDPANEAPAAEEAPADEPTGEPETSDDDEKNGESQGGPDGQLDTQPPADEDADDADRTAKPSAEQLKEDAEYYELFKVLADTMDQVERNYVKDVTRRELMEAAIRGVIEELDPYSNYIGPEELGRFRTSVESQFGGIGIQIDLRDEQLIVVSPLVGSPAYRAGLQAGDAIVEIEGQSTEGISLDEAIRRLKGEAGTQVTITVSHPQARGSSGGERRTITIDREVIRLDTVMGDLRNEKDRWDFMLDGDKGIGYVRVTAFSRDTHRDLENALKELQSRNLRGLIVDLRGNPGGLLTSAVEIADMFLEDGTIVSTAGRNSPKRTWEARKPGTFTGFPMVLLVNRYSASASEIVSAALQDHKRAVVIGERTWGKGSVQNVIELENGKSALKLTTASYQRPSGHNIHRFPDAKETDEWGVMPDPGFEVKLNDEEFLALLRYRRDRDILLVNHSVQAQQPGDAHAAGSETPATDEKDADPQSKREGDGDLEQSGQSKSEPSTPSESEVDGQKKDPPQPDAQEVDEEGSDAEEDAEETEEELEPKATAFVDRQLQKAIEYLTTELARAGD